MPSVLFSITALVALQLCLQITLMEGKVSFLFGFVLVLDEGMRETLLKHVYIYFKSNKLFSYRDKKDSPYLHRRKLKKLTHE